MIETIYFSYVEVPPAPMEAVLHDHNYYFYICETEMVFCEDKETSIKEDLSLAVKTEDDPLSGEWNQSNCEIINSFN